MRVVSAYFHSGEKDTPKQEAKMAHLPRIGARMAELLAEEAARWHVVARVRRLQRRALADRHQELEAEPNKRAGVLDEEIAFLNQWVDEGWRDTVRDLAGDVQGPYSWWSWRGQAFVNNAGWRIDYQYATPALGGERRAPSKSAAPTGTRSASRDHAPVSVTYDI